MSGPAEAADLFFGQYQLADRQDAPPGPGRRQASRFVARIVIGHGLGVAAKLAEFHQTGMLSLLVWLYPWNLPVTAFDLWLVLGPCRAERKRQAGAVLA